MLNFPKLSMDNLINSSGITLVGTKIFKIKNIKIINITNIKIRFIIKKENLLNIFKINRN